MSIGGGDQGIDPAREREAADADGAPVRERVDRWPRVGGGGARPTALALFRRSPLGCLDGGLDEEEDGRPDEGWGGDGLLDPLPGTGATFLNVMVHLTSSPAKTT